MEKIILNIMLYEKVSPKIGAYVLIVGIKGFDWWIILPMVKKGNVYGEWCNNEIHGKSCENRVKFMH